MADSVTCVQLLLDLGAVSIGCENSISQSAVYKAALHSRSIAEMLMWCGAMVHTLNVSTCNMTPVFLASQFGKHECLKLLLHSLTISGTQTYLLF